DDAGSFEELTALLERDSDVDLVLLDLTMPGINGFSGLIYLRAQYPSIPVVIVSASDDVGTIRRSLDFGASGFIPKRFGVETLRDAIRDGRGENRRRPMTARGLIASAGTAITPQLPVAGRAIGRAARATRPASPACSARLFFPGARQAGHSDCGLR